MGDALPPDAKLRPHTGFARIDAGLHLNGERELLRV